MARSPTTAPPSSSTAGDSACARPGCHCHRHPTGGFLAIADDWINGTVGLVSWRDGCDCCQPWTADELAAVVRDLANIETNCDTQQLD